jgi:hypothetical protein
LVSGVLAVCNWVLGDGKTAVTTTVSTTAMAVTTTAVTAAVRPQRPSSLCRRRFGRGWRRFRHSSAAATVRVLFATFSSAVGDGFAIWVLLAMFQCCWPADYQREIGL